MFRFMRLAVGGSGCGRDGASWETKSREACAPRGLWGSARSGGKTAHKVRSGTPYHVKSRCTSWGSGDEGGADRSSDNGEGENGASHLDLGYRNSRPVKRLERD